MTTNQLVSYLRLHFAHAPMLQQSADRLEQLQQACAAFTEEEAFEAGQHIGISLRLKIEAAMAAGAL